MNNTKIATPEENERSTEVQKFVGVGNRIRHAGKRQRRQDRKNPAMIPAIAVEAQNETQQIQTEGSDPKEGDRRDILRHVVRHGEKQRRCRRRQTHPEQLLRKHRRSRAVIAAHRSFRAAPAREERNRRASDCEHRVCDRPHPGLRAVRQIGFDQNRVCQKPRHRPRVGEREQPVRHRAAVRSRIPRLQQRTGGREQKIGQPDGRGQQPQNSQQRIARSLRLPPYGRQNWQRQQAQGEKRGVDDSLAAARLIAQPVRICIAAQQRHLKEEHATGPHCRRSAEPGQNQFCDQGLDLKKQECAKQNRCAEERRWHAPGGCGCHYR